MVEWSVGLQTLRSYLIGCLAVLVLNVNCGAT